jgi:hypothetical protein
MTDSRLQMHVKTEEGAAGPDWGSPIHSETGDAVSVVWLKCGITSLKSPLICCDRICCDRMRSHVVLPSMSSNA